MIYFHKFQKKYISLEKKKYDEIEIHFLLQICIPEY